MVLTTMSLMMDMLMAVGRDVPVRTSMQAGWYVSLNAVAIRMAYMAMALMRAWLIAKHLLRRAITCLPWLLTVTTTMVAMVMMVLLLVTAAFHTVAVVLVEVITMREHIVQTVRAGVMVSWHAQLSFVKLLCVVLGHNVVRPSPDKKHCRVRLETTHCYAVDIAQNQATIHKVYSNKKTSQPVRDERMCFST